MARVLSVPHPEEDLSLAKAVWKTAEPSVEADGHVIADANALFQETWNPLYRALHARTEQEVIEACAARIQKHRELRQTARSVLEAVRNLFRDLLENAGLGNDEDALRYMYYWTSIDSNNFFYFSCCFSKTADMPADTCKTIHAADTLTR